MAYILAPVPALQYMFITSSFVRALFVYTFVYVYVYILAPGPALQYTIVYVYVYVYISTATLQFNSDASLCLSPPHILARAICTLSASHYFPITTPSYT